MISCRACRPGGAGMSAWRELQESDGLPVESGTGVHRRGCVRPSSTTMRSASSTASWMSWVAHHRGQATESVVEGAIGAAERIAGDRIGRRTARP